MAEWRTAIRSFTKYKETWTKLIELQDPHDTGLIAYARKTAHMFGKREEEGRTALGLHPTLGTKYGHIADDNIKLLDIVLANRAMDKEREEEILKQCDAEAAARALASALRDDEGVESDDDWQTVDSEESEEDEEEAEEQVEGAVAGT